VKQPCGEDHLKQVVDYQSVLELERFSIFHDLRPDYLDDVNVEEANKQRGERRAHQQPISRPCICKKNVKELFETSVLPLKVSLALSHRADLCQMYKLILFDFTNTDDDLIDSKPAEVCADRSLEVTEVDRLECPSCAFAMKSPT